MTQSSQRTKPSTPKIQTSSFSQWKSANLTAKSNPLKASPMPSSPNRKLSTSQQSQVKPKSSNWLRKTKNSSLWTNSFKINWTNLKKSPNFKTRDSTISLKRSQTNARETSKSSAGPSMTSNSRFQLKSNHWPSSMKTSTSSLEGKNKARNSRPRKRNSWRLLNLSWNSLKHKPKTSSLWSRTISSTKPNCRRNSLKSKLLPKILIGNSRPQSHSFWKRIKICWLGCNSFRKWSKSRLLSLGRLLRVLKNSNSTTRTWWHKMSS